MKKIIINEYLKTNYKPTDFPDKVIGDFVDYEAHILDKNGKTILLYCKAPEKIIDIARYVSLTTKPDKSSRTRHGLPQQSSVFGVLPRIPIREDYCRFSRKSKIEKENYKYALELNRLLALEYKRLLPNEYQKAIKEVRQSIDNSYRVIDTPWVNINFNMNQVIKYHRDSGNNKEDLSNVLIVKNGITGGHLVCPELNMTLAQEDGWMVFFRGQELLHGVTSVKFHGSNSYRSSIVNYTLSNLRHCYPYKQELQRLKEVKTRQAKNRKGSLEKLREYLEKRNAKNV